MLQIPPYTIESLIGRGGMGAVYKAKSPQGRAVAIKLLVATNSPEAAARFARETKLASQLGAAEGFVPVLDQGRAPAGPYIVMPLLDGGTLRDRLEKGQLSIATASGFGLALARSMGAAHERGIVHRDLKPENVLFDGPRPLIADLGLGKDLLATPDALSKTGVFLGTPGYTAPEQINDAKSVGPGADVFALGAILYECLVGTAAFEGDDPHSRSARIASGTLTPPRKLRPEIPRDLEAVVLRALASDPLERYRDARELEHALRAVGGRGPSRAPLLAAVGVLVLLLLVAAFLIGRASQRAPLPPPPPPAAKDAQARLDRAIERENRGELKEAIADCDALIAEKPTALTYIVRGIAKGKLKDLPGAIADYEHALRLDPRAPLALLNLGAARATLGDRKAAMDLYTRALEADPKLVLAWENRGELRAAGGDRPGGISDLSRAIELAPRDAELLGSRARMRLEDGDQDGFLADASQSLAIDPRNAELLQVRGTLYWSRGDVARGRADLDAAIALEPRNARARASRGALRSNSGDLQGALEDLDIAIEVEPTFTNAWVNRGTTRNLAGDKEGARADWTRASELDPNGKWGQRARELLR